MSTTTINNPQKIAAENEIALTKVQELLKDNASFKARQLTPNSIGTYTFDTWEKATAILQTECYRVATTVYNRGLTSKDGKATTEEMRGIYSALKECFSLIGTVNGVDLYKLNVDENIGVLVYGFSYCFKATKEKEYKNALTDLSDAKKDLKTAKDNGEDDERIKELSDRVDSCNSEVTRIANIPDQYYMEFSDVKPAAFRKAFEDLLGNMIKGTHAMTPEEMLAILEQKRAERKAKQEAKRARAKAERAREKAEKAQAEADEKAAAAANAEEKTEPTDPETPTNDIQ